MAAGGCRELLLTDTSMHVMSDRNDRLAADDAVDRTHTAATATTAAAAITVTASVWPLLGRSAPVGQSNTRCGALADRAEDVPIVNRNH